MDRQVRQVLESKNIWLGCMFMSWDFHLPVHSLFLSQLCLFLTYRLFAELSPLCARLPVASGNQLCLCTTSLKNDSLWLTRSFFLHVISPRGPTLPLFGSRLSLQPSFYLMGKLRKGYRPCQLKGGTVELHPALLITHLLPRRSQGLRAHQGHLFLLWGLGSLLHPQILACREHLLLLRQEHTGRNGAKSVFSVQRLLSSRPLTQNCRVR